MSVRENQSNHQNLKLILRHWRVKKDDLNSGAPQLIVVRQDKGKYKAFFASKSPNLGVEPRSCWSHLWLAPLWLLNFNLDSSFIMVNSDYKHFMNDYRLEEPELHRLWASFLIMDATHGQPFLLLPHFIAHLEGMKMAWAFQSGECT